MRDNKNRYPVAKMCKVMNINSSSYYYWTKNPESMRKKRDKQLGTKIQEIHKQSMGIYGSPRITKELKMQGEKVSNKRVSRLMKKYDISSKIKRKYRSTTNSKHDYPVAPNVLNREFNATKKAQKWVSDITYLNTQQGWLYLTIILDLFDRKIVGWSLSDNLTTGSTIIPALFMATKNRPIDKPLIFHSDRGVQYASKTFTSLLTMYPNITQSMSRKGNCWDNAVAENFFKALKTEWIYRHKNSSKEKTKSVVFQYIEAFYNTNRRHQYLNNLTITEFNTFVYQKLVA